MLEGPVEVPLHPIEVVIVQDEQRGQLVHVSGVGGGGNGAVAIILKARKLRLLLANLSVRRHRAGSAVHLHLHLRRWHRSAADGEQCVLLLLRPLIVAETEETVGNDPGVHSGCLVLFEKWWVDRHEKAEIGSIGFHPCHSEIIHAAQKRRGKGKGTIISLFCY